MGITGTNWYHWHTQGSSDFSTRHDRTHLSTLFSTKEVGLFFLCLRVCFVLTLNYFLGPNFPEDFHSLFHGDTSKLSANHFPTVFYNGSMNQTVAKEPEYKSHIKLCLALPANLNPTFLPLTFTITFLIYLSRRSHFQSAQS